MKRFLSMLAMILCVSALLGGCASNGADAADCYAAEDGSCAIVFEDGIYTWFQFGSFSSGTYEYDKDSHQYTLMSSGHTVASLTKDGKKLTGNSGVAGGKTFSKCSTKYKQSVMDNIKVTGKSGFAALDLMEVQKAVANSIKSQIKDSAQKQELNWAIEMGTQVFANRTSSVENGDEIIVAVMAPDLTSSSNILTATYDIELYSYTAENLKEQETITVDLSYVIANNLTSSGYDGYGIMDVSALNAKMRSHLSSVLQDYPASVQSTILNALSVTVDKTTKLSNGDTVNVLVTIPEEVSSQYKVLIQPTSVPFTVSGLKEVEVFDPFEGVEVTFSGVEGAAEIKITGYDSSTGINYTVKNDVSGNVKNDETITVVASPSYYYNSWNDYVDNTHRKPNSTEKSFTVTGLGQYVTSIDQIPQETMDAMNAQLVDVMHSQFSDQSNANIDSYNLLGEVLLTPKFEVKKGNALIFVYEASVSKGDIKQNRFFTLQYRNLIATETGTISVDLSAYQLLGGWEGYNYNFSVNFGYTTFDSFYSSAIRSQLDAWKYTTNIENFEILAGLSSGNSSAQTSDSRETQISSNEADSSSEGSQMESSVESGTALPEKRKINASAGVNLRSGPGTNYNAIGGIPNENLVTVTELQTIDGTVWAKTTYKDKTGWFAYEYSVHVD